MERINKQKEYIDTVRCIFSSIEFNVTEPCELRRIIENVCYAAHTIIDKSELYEKKPKRCLKK